MTLNFLRSPIVTLVLIILVIAQSGPEIAHAVDSVIDGNIVFTGPNQGGAKDIRTSNTEGGLRIFNGQTLSPIPEGAAIQFFGNGSVAYPGQAYIDSGAHNNAALIFRTAGTGQGIAERMRVTATGNVGIGTNNPQEQLELTGNFRLPATTATTGIIRSGSSTLLHTFGINNFFAGIGAGNLTMTGTFNTATGTNAMLLNTTGNQNTVTGTNALSNNTTGSGNTVVGAQALLSNTTGNNNTAGGNSALQNNITGNNNTASGNNALSSNTTGNSNTAGGTASLQSNTTGSGNTASGNNALSSNTTGNSNTAGGTASLQSNTTGNGNAAIANNALENNTTGNSNVGLGTNAGSANITGSGNTFIGVAADAAAGNLQNATAIGASAIVGQSNSIVLGGTGGSAVNVGIGTTTPISTLQVVGGYLQFSATSAGAPTATDCDADAERGRLVIDTTFNLLYVCNGSVRGWDSIALNP